MLTCCERAKLFKAIIILSGSTYKEQCQFDIFEKILPLVHLSLVIQPFSMQDMSNGFAIRKKLNVTVLSDRDQYM